MSKHPCTLARFLTLVEGNWRNAVFIDSCGPSACLIGKPCSGHLFSADADGSPVLIPADLFCRLTGEQIDPAECGGRLSRFAFERAYHRKLLWLSPSDQLCGVRELASSQPPLPCMEAVDKPP